MSNDKLRRESIFIHYMAPSTNAFDTMHYQVRKKEKNKIKLVCKEAFKDIKPFDKRVNITFVPICGMEWVKRKNRKTKKVEDVQQIKRAYDTDNYSKYAKHIIDSLTDKSNTSAIQQGKSILEDDTAEHVVGVGYKPPLKDRELQGSGMYVIIEEVSDDYDPYADLF